MDETYLKRELARLADEVDPGIQIPRRTRVRGWIRAGRNGVVATSTVAAVVLGVLLVPSLLERSDVVPPGSGPKVEGYAGRLLQSGTYDDGTWLLSAFYAEGQLCLHYEFQGAGLGSGSGGCRPFRPGVRAFVQPVNPDLNNPSALFGFVPRTAARAELRLDDGQVVPLQLVEPPYEMDARFFIMVPPPGPGRIVALDEDGVPLGRDAVTSGELRRGHRYGGTDELIVARGRFRGQPWSLSIAEEDGKTCFMINGRVGGSGSCIDPEQGFHYVASYGDLPGKIVVAGAVADDIRSASLGCIDCLLQARLVKYTGGEPGPIEYVVLRDVPHDFFVAFVQPESGRFSAEILVVDGGTIIARDFLCDGGQLTRGGACVGPIPDLE